MDWKNDFYKFYDKEFMSGASPLEMGGKIVVHIDSLLTLAREEERKEIEKEYMLISKKPQHDVKEFYPEEK